MDIDQYTAKKLTHNQKRGFGPGKSSSMELHNDRRAVDAPKPRLAAELVRAQLALAELALDADDPQEWLTDVLEAMGLRQRIDTSPPPEYAECGIYEGTKRGYNIHLRGYTKLCEACGAWGLQQTLAEAGVDMEEAEEWIIGHS